VTYRVSDIPHSVKIAFAKATQELDEENQFSMAEPGSWPWNAGDAILDGLPRRRLKAVAATDSLCLVFYEHGGYAKTDDVGAFRLTSDGADAIWHLSIPPDVVSPANLRKAIRGRAYGDERY
jgi:hypothetical protein